MGKSLDGHLCRLVRTDDNAGFSGVVLLSADSEFVLEPRSQTPNPGDAVRVELVTPEGLATGAGLVVAACPKAVVVKCPQLKFHDCRAHPRRKMEGLVISRRLEGGFVSVRVTDLSLGGFGFETSTPMRAYESADFEVTSNGRRHRIQGLVAHVRLDPDGLYRGGIRLHQNRLAHAVLSSWGRPAA